MTEKDRDWLRKILHTEFASALARIDTDLKGRVYATAVAEALAEEIDMAVEACIDLADEESANANSPT